MNQASGQSGSGRWVVAFLLLAGILGAAAAYAWWSHQQDSWRQQGVTPKDAAGSSTKTDEAQREIELVGERFTAAVDANLPLDPVRDAAARLVEKYPGSADARRLYGQVLLAMEDKAAAYDQLKLSLDIDARQAEVAMLAGTISEELGDIDRAMVHYHTAVTLAPNNPKYHTFLGNAYLVKGDKAKATQMLLEAIRLDSMHHRAYAVLAHMRAEEGKTTLALEQLERAIDHTPIAERPAQVGYLRFKATLLRRDNRPGEALQVLTEELLPREQLDKHVLPDLATTWAMLGEPGKAAEVYENAIAADPTRWELLIDATQWRLKAGHMTAAQQHIDALRRLQPNHPALAELQSALTQPATGDDAAQGR